MDIVKVTLKVEEVIGHYHDFEGNEYITFEVVKMQNADKFVRTYTAYVLTPKETEDEKPKKSSKK